MLYEVITHASGIKNTDSIFSEYNNRPFSDVEQETSTNEWDMREASVEYGLLKNIYDLLSRQAFRQAFPGFRPAQAHYRRKGITKRPTG